MVLPSLVLAFALGAMLSVAGTFGDVAIIFLLTGRRPANSMTINDFGTLFAAALVGIAPVAVACVFFADTCTRGLGAGVLD